MAEGGRRLAAVLARLREVTRAGVTTRSLDRLAYQMIHASGAKPAFLHYRPYGRAAGVSVFTLHFIERRRGARPAVGLRRERRRSCKIRPRTFIQRIIFGYGGTVAVGKVGREAERLVAATEEALAAALLRRRQSGKRSVTSALRSGAWRRRTNVRWRTGLTGHGIGRDLHEEPPVFNIGRRRGRRGITGGHGASRSSRCLRRARARSRNLRRELGDSRRIARGAF